MFQHLLVALDGSDLANKALSIATELAKAHGSRMTILTSTDHIDTGLGTGGFGLIDAASIIKKLEQAYAAQAQEILDAAKDATSKGGVAAEILYVPRQKASDSILETSDRIGCDVVIMGSHGRQGLQQLLLGSQAAAVVAKSKIPVLIIK